MDDLKAHIVILVDANYEHPSYEFLSIAEARDLKDVAEEVIRSALLDNLGKWSRVDGLNVTVAVLPVERDA
jgi:hypothetical protein